ncbi:MAG: 3-oxoacyl-[acyl-carrier-protein] synthase III C-terminal domain-containing protein [Nannocystaceae bacterium]
MSVNPHLVGLGTALPEHVVERSEARAFVEQMFSGRVRGLERLLSVFEHPRMHTRHLIRPLAWYASTRDFAEKNRVYCEAALALMETAANRALERSEVARHAIVAVVVATSTGIATPSLDATLVQRLGLSRSVQRVPLWGLGCAGGGAAVARASALARGLGGAVLLVAVEVCSATFVPQDHRISNIVAASIFSDGAAAAVIVPEREGGGLELLASHCRLFDDSQEVMGWDVTPEGFRVRFSKSIPQIVSEHTRSLVDAACGEAGVHASSLRHFLPHPGGPKVIEAYAQSLAIDESSLRHAWEVLRACGNMSSPTVLFVLERFLKAGPKKGSLGILMALGPGFCAETTVFRVR